MADKVNVNMSEEELVEEVVEVIGEVTFEEARASSVSEDTPAVERMIERLIEEGKISREELDAMIADERKKNPIRALVEENNRLRAATARMGDYTVEMDFRIMVLEMGAI